MKLENWIMSRDKWEPIHAEFEKPSRVNWEKVEELLDKQCGHCMEHGEFLIYEEACDKCTLRNPLMCGFYEENSSFNMLIEIVSGYRPRNKRKARRIVNRIYKQILKDKPEGM
jgi:hypothetical protein